ncbi:MAG: GumC family protein [Candidatus Sulfotelmatobacter sp.]
MESVVFPQPVPVRGYEDHGSHVVVSRLRLLLEQRIFLFRVTAYGLALSTLLAFLIPFRYEAHTQLMPPDSELSSGLGSLLAMTARTGNGLGMLAGDLLGVRTSGSLFIGILRSQTVEDRIIDQFDLKSVYSVRLVQNARRQLEANTQITEDRKSGIISIAVTDHSPQRAAAMAQAYVAELDRLVVELNTSAAHRERVFLEERLKSVKQDLDSSAKEFSEFASKNTAIDIKEQGRAMVEAAANLQGNLIAAQSELEGLRQIYSDSNVRVRAVRARIDELQKKLQQMGGGDLNPSTADSASDSLYPSIRKLPLLGVTYADLYRKTRIQETLFELLTQQCELAKVQEAKETPSVKVLDVATIPEKKSFPPRLLIMFLGAFLALMLGTSWVVGAARWKDMDPEHPGKLLVRDIRTQIAADLRLNPENGTRLRHMRDKILWLKRPSKEV